MVPTIIIDILIRNLLIPSLKRFANWEPNGKVGWKLRILKSLSNSSNFAQPLKNS